MKEVEHQRPSILTFTLWYESSFKNTGSSYISHNAAQQHLSLDSQSFQMPASSKLQTSRL